ncbi:MAG: thioredoxin [Halobacteriota archaeon]
MSDAEDIDAIRQKKREELAAKLESGAGASPQQDDGGEQAPSEPIHLTGADHLSEVTATYDLVLVDFFAEWCGPCKMLEPTLEELARETDAAIAKLDIDAHQRLAAQYGVQGVPNLLLFVDGEPTERIVGAQPKGRFEQLIGAYA